MHWCLSSCAPRCSFPSTEQNTSSHVQSKRKRNNYHKPLSIFQMKILQLGGITVQLHLFSFLCCREYNLITFWWVSPHLSSTALEREFWILLKKKEAMNKPSFTYSQSSLIQIGIKTPSIALRNSGCSSEAQILPVYLPESTVTNCMRISIQRSC